MPHASLGGITLNQKIYFVHHTREVAPQARHTLGFILRLSCNLLPNTFKDLYIALVIPQYEICYAIWDHHQQPPHDISESI